MKKPLIIGNWKSNKTPLEAEQWLNTFKNLGDWPGPEVVICVPFPALTICQTIIAELNLAFKLGVQNVSPFDSGAYTGEVSARMLAGLAQYCLIGHSERRKYFAESDETVKLKVKQAQSANIRPIVCIQDESTPVPDNVDLIAYEPIWAIGSGKPDTPKHASQMAENIRKKYPGSLFIYGGSVTATNITSFISQANIDGVLLGGASLEAKSFYELVRNAATIQT